MPDPTPPPGIDTSVLSIARVYDYLLGGRNNYAVDRRAAVEFLEAWPEVRANAQAIRGFAMRTVREIAAKAHINQFLDLGSGLPTQENVHQVAQRLIPNARVMYVDNDPSVLAHGRALLNENELTDYAEADARDADSVLAQAAQLLNFAEPVAIICSALLHWIPEDPTDLLARYVEALAPGSVLVCSHNTAEGVPAAMLDRMHEVFRGGWYPRTPGRIEAMFQGLPLADPGLVRIEEWRPDEPQPVRLQLPLLGAAANL